MKRKVFLLSAALMLFVLPLLSIQTAAAEGPTPEQVAAERLQQEPALYCVAFEAGVPASAVALAKVRFDTRYGAVEGISGEAWTATWYERMQYFVDWLGLSSPMTDSALKPWCARLLDAQAKIFE